MSNAHVHLEGDFIGELRKSDGSSLSLDFTDSYVTNRLATALSVVLPNTEQAHAGSVVENWLWGLLPDNEDVLRRWARDQDTSLSSPFGLLVSEIGLDCAGAVQFTPSDRDLNSLDRDSGLTALSETDIAADLAQLRRDATAWRGGSSTGQFSLAGAQAKTALHLAGSQWSRPRGEVPSTHILKPAPAGWSDLDINEHICLATARQLGLAAARTSVTAFGPERAIVVERYDRNETPEGLERLHQEDMCQASGLHPKLKYESDGGPTAAQVAQLLRSAVEQELAEREVKRFADALIFNWIIGGTDGHAKNYSIVHSQRSARLAPLYDISSALPYDDSGGRKLSLAMKVGGEYRMMRIDNVAWAKEAQNLNLDATHLLDRCAELAERLPSAMEAVVNSMTDSNEKIKDSDLPGRLLKAVRQRSAECGEALRSGHPWRQTNERARFAILARDKGPTSDLPESDTTSVNLRLVVRPPGENEWYYYQYVAVRWPNSRLVVQDEMDEPQLAASLVAAAVSAVREWVESDQADLTDSAIDAVVLEMGDRIEDGVQLADNGEDRAQWIGEEYQIKRRVGQMESIGASLSKVGARRAELRREPTQVDTSNMEHEAQRQLALLGEAIQEFDAEVRQLVGEVVLLVRPAAQRITDAFDELIGHAGDPMRLITVRMDLEKAQISAVVETRPGTWGNSPSTESLDARAPERIVSALLDDLADPLAIELNRLNEEFN